MTSEEVKKIAFRLGADLCGIASMDRFDHAPKDFHPRDVLPTCQSVISFGCRFPEGALACASAVPYTRIRNSITPKMDAIALDLCIELEKLGALAVPIPTNEDVWDQRTSRWRSIISQKHAAQAAGLGTIGRNTQLITPEFGSMIWLGCVLTEAELQADALKESICDHCNLCVDVCPVHALESDEMAQQKCWDYAFGDNPETKRWEISCHKCKDICPYNLGTENKQLKR